MNRFLTLILGAVLCGAAPLHAQQAGPSAPDHAAALLKMAQEAAAQGDAQRASEYARAAAELYSVQPRAGEPARVAVVRSRAAAEEHARAAEEHVRAAQVQERAAQERAAQGFAAAVAAAPTIEDAFMRETRAAEGQEPAAPGVRWRRAPDAAGPPPPMAFAMPSGPAAQGPGRGESGPAAAPRAPHQDEIGMTLRLIHAEVQALRAEVQALRAEMSLMRMQGRAVSGMTSHGAVGRGFWTQEAGPDQREVVIVTPDGERRVVIHRQGEAGTWSAAPSAPMLEDFDAEAVMLEDVMEELQELGYVDSAAAPDREDPSTAKFRFRVGPEGKWVEVPAAPATPPTPSVPAVPRTPRR